MSEINRRKFILASGAMLFSACGQTPSPTPTPEPRVASKSASNPDTLNDLFKLGRTQDSPTSGAEIKRPEITPTVENLGITYEVGRIDRPAFFSNGLIMGTSEDLLVLGQNEIMSKLVHDSRFGFNLPDDYFIATVFDQVPLEIRNPETVRKQIPFAQIKPQLQDRFPALRVPEPKYSVNAISLIEVGLATNGFLVSNGWTANSPDDFYKIMSLIASRQWLLSLRERYSADRNLPIPPRSISNENMQIIADNLPLKILPGKPLPVIVR